VSVLCVVLSCVRVTESSEQSEQVPGGQSGPDELALFQALFRYKHANILEAVKTVVTLDYAKQHQMLTMVIDKMSTVLPPSRVMLESSGYVPGAAFPSKPEVKEALSNIVENTVLYGELLLRLPELMQSVMKGKNDLQLLMNWSIMFTSETKLLDVLASKLIHLTTQELNLTEREPDYVNPYRTKKSSEFQTGTSTNKPSKKKKEKVRGPRLSSARVSGEL